jgi:hypothetical protein
VSSLGIFIYGVVVFAFVATAMGILAWGIVTERRDRLARVEDPSAFDGGGDAAARAGGGAAGAGAGGAPARPRPGSTARLSPRG